VIVVPPAVNSCREDDCLERPAPAAGGALSFRPASVNVKCLAPAPLPLPGPLLVLFLISLSFFGSSAHTRSDFCFVLLGAEAIATAAAQSMELSDAEMTNDSFDETVLVDCFDRVGGRATGGNSTACFGFAKLVTDPGVEVVEAATTNFLSISDFLALSRCLSSDGLVLPIVCSMPSRLVGFTLAFCSNFAAVCVCDDTGESEKRFSSPEPSSSGFGIGNIGDIGPFATISFVGDETGTELSVSRFIVGA
jgi:hypothetical protein